MIKQYRKKPVVIQAAQWTGENFEEPYQSATLTLTIPIDPLWSTDVLLEKVGKSFLEATDLLKKKREKGVSGK